VIGGLTSETNSTAEIQVLDFNTFRWKKSPTALPIATNRLGAVAANGELWIMGGQTSDGTTVDAAYRFSLAHRQLEKIPALKERRKNFAVAAVGDSIIVGGGWDDTGGKKKFLASTEIYRIGYTGWRSGPLLKAGRDGTRAAVVDGHFITIGGYNDGGLLSSVENIDPSGGN
jgi:N-acetylneuraminic acid mutarotase